MSVRETICALAWDELSKRWSEAFQRKGVKLDATLTIDSRHFDWTIRRLQTGGSDLLDNALKTYAERRHVMFRAAAALLGTPWWRPGSGKERRRFKLPRPNSVEVSVTDSGSGIAAEHHQEFLRILCAWTGTRLEWGLGLRSPNG